MKTEQNEDGMINSQKKFESLVVRCALVLIVTAFASRTGAVDRSEPAMLQMFEAKWTTIEERMPDIFATGYGQMWLPPPQRAEGGQSVGYDVFDRFDLGSPRNETLYGTEKTLKASIAAAHNASVRMYTDFVPNHNGFRNKNTTNFVTQGGYPGFTLTAGSDGLGDFHNPSVSYQQDPINGSLFGLIDIAHEKNHEFIRNPVQAGNPDNLPAGTIWNKPDPNNARFYPDDSLSYPTMNDPNTGTGGTFTRKHFNLDNPLAGDPKKENATGLLMRNMHWMIEVIGVDGFRVDAARHMPTWVFNYLDHAVYATSPRLNHDGTIKPMYMFSEVADGTSGNVQPYIRRDLPNKFAIAANETTVKGNRDALDFPLFWRMVDNLSGNGFQNNWHRIKNAHLDANDDGLKNGSQGVTFVDSHDEHSGLRPHLYKVAYAYTLMMPGNALVYLNAKEFGEGRDFPDDIGGSGYAMSNDALGGFHPNHVAKLVEIRNTHGRGNFKERYIDDAFNPNGFSNIYIYERENSAVVGLNSRLDVGFDSRTISTGFAPNSVLVELTGNANSGTVDPNGDIPETVRVNASGQATIRVPRNSGHGRGYVIYGVAAPRGTLSLSNVSQVLAGATPTQANNGTARLANIDVITANSFQVRLDTTPVTLAAPMGESTPYRDFEADGDQAVIRIDEGMNLNNIAGIDRTNPADISYAFEDFTDTRVPGYINQGGVNVGSGTGLYIQNIDATQLSEGRHFITVRAYRRRAVAGTPVYTDFKRTIYVDRLKPVSEVVSFEPYASDPNNPNNRDLIVESTDQTADAVHLLLDLPANLTEAQILAQVNAGNKAGFYDRDQFIRGFSGLVTGNHVATIVTYEPTGNFNIQRKPGLFTDTDNGLGFGDMNGSNAFTTGDIVGTGNNSVEDVLYSQNSKFRAAFDVNGDGLGDNRDLFLLGNELAAAGAGQAILNSYTGLLLKRGDFNNSGTTDSADMAALYAGFGPASWLYDLNVDGVVNISDVSTMISQLVRTVAGDFNLDGAVDTADYVIWRDSEGSTGALYTQGDADLDGDVDALDLVAWRNQFGFVRQPLTPGGGGSLTAQHAVPEPTNFAALVVASIFLGLTTKTRRTRRKAGGAQVPNRAAPALCPSCLCGANCDVHDLGAEFMKGRFWNEPT